MHRPTHIIEGQPVTTISNHQNIWKISAPDQDYEAPYVVNCAGAWGGNIATMLGDFAPVEAQALMLMITERLAAFIKPVVGAQGRLLSFKQFENGTVLIGGAYQGWAKPENNAAHLDFKGLAANAASAAAIFPIMKNARIMR